MDGIDESWEVINWRLLPLILLFLSSGIINNYLEGENALQFSTILIGTFFTSTSVSSFNLVWNLKLGELVCQYRNKYFSAIV